MKKKIIAMVAALTTAFCTCFSPAYAIDANEEIICIMKVGVSISALNPQINSGDPRETYTGNAHVRLIRTNENGEEIRQIGEWDSSELNVSSMSIYMKTEFEYTINSEDETSYFSWIVDGIDEEYHPIWDWDDPDKKIVIMNFSITPKLRKYFENERQRGEDYGSYSSLELVPNGYIRDEESTAGIYLIYGDANLDDSVTISDSVAILQYIANADEYPLDDVAKANADVYNQGDGITGKDADSIMKFEAGVISSLPETLS